MSTRKKNCEETEKRISVICISIVILGTIVVKDLLQKDSKLIYTYQVFWRNVHLYTYIYLMAVIFSYHNGNYHFCKILGETV